jgi:hypothetical protein
MSDFPAEAPAMIRARQRLLTETPLGRFISSAACAALLIASAPAPLLAQVPPPPPQQGPGPQGGFQGGPQGGPQDQQQQGYSPEQLDALLAPIALYPDQLLTQVLMATAFPDEVQAAQQWVSNPANAQLRGDQLSAVLTPIQWDPSVKSLIPFPQVLAMMTQQPDWMQQLGYAMSVQQQDVMASVQRLRQQAQIAGNLRTTSQQVCRTEEVQGQSTIVIEPAQPDVVYVPSYNPVQVYGAWPYPSYPPYYLPPPVGYDYGAALVGGIAFGAAVAVGVGLWGGLYGWARPNWGGGNVFINVNNYNRWAPYRPWRGGGGGYWHPYRPLARPGWGYRAPAAAYHPPGGYRFNPNNRFRAAPVHYGRQVSAAAYRGPVNGANNFHGAPGINAGHPGFNGGRPGFNAGHPGVPETRPPFHAPTNMPHGAVPGRMPNETRPGANHPGNPAFHNTHAGAPVNNAHRSQIQGAGHTPPAHPNQGGRPAAGGGFQHAGGANHPPAGGGYHPPGGGGFHPPGGGAFHPPGGGGHPGGGGGGHPGGGGGGHPGGGGGGGHPGGGGDRHR